VLRTSVCSLRPCHRQTGSVKPEVITELLTGSRQADRNVRKPFEKGDHFGLSAKGSGLARAASL
jgi:hypothetical protein